MKNSKVASCLLFALWVPVALLICLARLVVWVLAKAAYRLNRGAWWAHGKVGKLGNSVGEWFYESACFEWLRIKHAASRKKALDEWMAND
ncbi:hypothetical protein KASHIRA_00320 [Serratia phage vB_SmaM-Kashira]|nr:hypothetical protein KASHIRA_00320 [Serratia phage vB_SmaM-Kashira]